MDLNLYWDSNPGAIAYIVEYKLHSSAIWTTFGTVTTNYITITGLANCSIYDFRITAQCDTETFSTPTITYNIYIEDGTCSMNAFCYMKYTNSIQPGDSVYFTQLSNDLGNYTTAGMPVIAGSTYTYTAPLSSWYTNNYILQFYNGSGYTTFSVNVYRNGLLINTYTITTVSSGTYIDLPIILDYPPNVGDTIEFVLGF